jgi:hypothetical protein
MLAKIVAPIGILAALVLTGLPARAAPPWVDRGIVLPRHDVAFNFGLGIAHANNTLGPGINFEGAGAITRGLELGFRTGLRFDGAARAGDADRYGRPFDTETYGEGSDTLSNPEARLRGALVQGDVFELALEGRVYTPFSDGFGIMFGVPMAFHIGRSVRLDMGIYVPVLFYDPTRAFVSFPLHLWIQATDRLWLGPLVGLRFRSNAPFEPAPQPQGGGTVDVPLGFGLGYQIARAVDFKTWFLFQDVAHGPAQVWGFGAGLEIRIE